jgi:hypothetical protein
MRGVSGRGDREQPFTDSVAVLDGPDDKDTTGAKSALTRAELARVWLEIGAAVTRECAGGEVHAFATAADVATCRYCPYIKICPGPGMVSA